MIVQTSGITQTRAARLAGFLWVLTMATSMFATLYGFSRNVVPGDVAKTAANIIAHETSFRVGVALMLFTTLGVIVLIWAFLHSSEVSQSRTCLIGIVVSNR
jgi:hypothetical protein